MSALTRPTNPKPSSVTKRCLEHFERHLGKRKFIEAVNRADIDDSKTTSKPSVLQRGANNTPVSSTPRTINFEVSVLRTFFYFLENERGLKIETPCAASSRSKTNPPKPGENPRPTRRNKTGRLLAGCADPFEGTTFATLLLIGLRKQELYYLAWADVDFKKGTIRVTPRPIEGFSPKGYEERITNTIMAGCSIQGRRFTAQEASDAASVREFMQSLSEVLRRSRQRLQRNGS